MSDNMTRDPWERIEGRKGESMLAFLAFQTYRDMGPQRTINATARVLGKSENTLSAWSRRYQWAMRAAAYDDYNDQIKRDAMRKEIEDMGARHAKQAQTLLQGLAVPSVALSQRFGADQEGTMKELTDLPVVDLLTLISRAAALFPNVMRAERLARGVPTEVVEEQLGVAEKRPLVSAASLPSDVAEQILQLIEAAEDDAVADDTGD